MQDMVHTEHWKNKPCSRFTVPCPFEMMVESSPMLMGILLLVSREDKESLMAIMWFEASESMSRDLGFKVLSMREWPLSCR